MSQGNIQSTAYRPSVQAAEPFGWSQWAFPGFPREQHRPCPVLKSLVGEPQFHRPSRRFCASGHPGASDHWGPFSLVLPFWTANWFIALSNAFVVSLLSILTKMYLTDGNEVVGRLQIHGVGCPMIPFQCASIPV